MDVGRAPPIEMSLEAHAGCLAFEFSTPKHDLLIVNCGMPPTTREEWRQLARATPAHSTLTFNDESSARFVISPALRRVLGGAPMIDGPSRVTVTREDRLDAIVLRAAHDGYVERFGVVHERTVMLSGDGTRLEGEDVLTRVSKGKAADCKRPLRGALSSASVRQGEPARRRPRRHADDAAQGSVDVRGARRPGRTRGQRLSRWSRGPAAYRATRHLRSRARDAARRLEPASSLRSPPLRSPRAGWRAPKSRNCRCEAGVAHIVIARLDRAIQ